MSEGDDLYRAVLDSPEDDAPRLIYADWLDEHGRPDRAEFIRLQCAMDRIPPGTARWKPLFERAQRLEREGRVAWTGPAQERVLETRLRRGFVDWARLTIDQFVHFAEELVRLEPIRVWSFSEVALFGRRPSFTRLASNQSLTVVRGLDTGRFLPDELVRTLATSKYLSELRTLIIPNRHPQPDAIAALFNRARKLDQLEVADSHVADVKDLWRRGAEARLRRLSLARCRATDQTAAQLAGSAALVRLEALRLDGNDITDRGAEALAATEHMTGLRELSLAGNPVGDAGAAALARSPALRNVRVLNLSDCQIDSGGAQALADSPYLGGLECLCLDDNRVSFGVEAELKSRFGPEVCSFSWTP
jgi:uncharacterized protein (TIGR02996 family)